MAKNKKVSNETKRKVPLNVFRKGAMALAAAGIMIATPLMLTGCAGEKGEIGPAGATWIAGTADPATNQGVVGDFYYDTDSYIIYQKGENGWVVVSTIKPAVTINNDGYWVIDGTATTVKAKAPEVFIDSNGFWVINGTTTEYNANPDDGKSAYEIAKAGGYTGTEAEWIASLKGVKGDDGKSAYEIAKAGGYAGTETEWVASLKGEKGNDGLTPYIGENGNWWIGEEDLEIPATGDNGKSAYEIAYELDNTIGSQTEWIASLKGAKGNDGLTPYIGENGNWWIDEEDLKIPATGEKGKSAYDIAKAGGYTGTETEWVASLKGSKGDDGESAYEVALRLDSSIGTEAEWLASLKGEKGETGSIWLTGEGEPTESARVNDYYLDTKSGDVYVKTSEEWSKVGNIKGAKGDAGEDALTIKSFRKVVDTTTNKWGMVYYYELTMSDNSIVDTETSTEILENHYYTATETGDIEKLLELGVKYIRLGNDVEIAEGSTFMYITSDLNLDLNGYTLNSDRCLVFDSCNVNVYNGDLSFDMAGEGYASIYVRKGSIFNLNDVEMKVSVGIGFAVYNAKLTVEDSKIDAEVYTISTNASSEENYPNDVTVKDSVLSTVGGNNYDNTAILMNVPGTLLIEDSELYGDRQGIIARGGETTIKNSKVVLTGAWYEAQEYGDEYAEGATWLDGNKVPSAAIVLGNNNTSAYQYASTLNLENAKISSKLKFDLDNIYAQGNVSEGEEYIGATLNINNEDLTVIDLSLANVDYETVKMSVAVSNKETIDELMKFVKMQTFGIPDEYKYQAIMSVIEVINPYLTQDIFIMEEEMSYEKLNEYMQANSFLAGENSSYRIYASALSITVSTAEELETAYEMGPVKLLADIELVVASEEEKGYMLEGVAQGLIDTNGFDLTITVDTTLGGGDSGSENPGTEPEVPISYTQVGTRDELINAIQSAPVGEMVYIELTANIQLTSDDDNTIFAEFMESGYAEINYGPNDEYDVIAYIDPNALANAIEVSSADEVLALIDGKDMATCEPIYIKLTQDIVISATAQEKLIPWYEAEKLIPVNMGEYNFIPEGQV